MALLPKKRSAEPEVENSTRSRIVDGARHHFLAHGFRAVTMDDLAEELGMSKKTLYVHFSTKTELVEAVLRAKFSQIEADLAQIASSCGDDFIAGLHATLETIQRQAQEVQPPFIRDIRREEPEMFSIVEKRRAEMIKRHFTKLFDEGRRAGLLRRDIPVKVIIEILLGAVAGIMNPKKMEELGLTPKTGFMTIIRVVLQGVITDKERIRK